jgi:anti-anti-sigma factor
MNGGCDGIVPDAQHCWQSHGHRRRRRSRQRDVWIIVRRRRDSRQAGILDLVVDLDAVEFIDSSRLGVLAGGLRRVQAHLGSLALVCSNSGTLHLLRITGLDQVLPAHPDIASIATAIADGE